MRKSNMGPAIFYSQLKTNLTQSWAWDRNTIQNHAQTVYSLYWLIAKDLQLLCAVWTRIVLNLKITPKNCSFIFKLRFFSWNKPLKKIYFGKCSKGKNYCKISIDTSRRGKTEEQVARNFNPNRGSNLCSHTRGFAFSRQSFEVENFNVAFAMDKLLTSCPQCREPYSIRCK